MIKWSVGRFLLTNSRSVLVNNALQVQKRWKKSDTNIKSNLGSSTIMIQDGTSVSEVPLVIRKVTNIMHPIVKHTTGNEHHKSFCNSDVFNLIHKEFLKCTNFHEVVTLLSKCSRITPNIAAGAVERILVLKECGETKSKYEVHADVLEMLLSDLVVTVMKSENAYTIVNCMKNIPSHLEEFRNALCNTLLEKILDRALSVLQLCDVVEAFSQNTKYYGHLDNADKLWFGFAEMELSIGKKEIVRCYEVVHYLKCSRRMIINVLERRLDKLWCELDGKDIGKILTAVRKNNLSTSHTLTCAGRWLSASIHSLSDNELLDFLDRVAELDYTDENIQKSLERFVKSKGVNITLDMLVVAILNHCVLFRLRNTIILNGCAQYIVAHGRKMEPIYVKPIFYPFAWLNFSPPLGSRFWEEFEIIFNERFHRMNKEDVLDTLIGCIYLQKYPLNFMNMIYNPCFLDKINASPQKDILRNKMKLFDTAMTIECKAYGGPMLPKELAAKSLWQDGRISRMINNLREDLEVISGGAECFSTHVILPNIFATELYLVDIMLHPKGLKNSILNFNQSSDRNINTALLIQLPEHYASTDILIGPQAMRIRHLQLLGLNVVNLKYETLAKLRLCKEELQVYLIDSLKYPELT